jgi:hypothetical protein
MGVAGAVALALTVLLGAVLMVSGCWWSQIDGWVWERRCTCIQRRMR